MLDIVEDRDRLRLERDVWCTENVKKQAACEQMGARITALEDETHRLKDALSGIADWAGAYPEDVFPPLDIEEARQRLSDDALFSRLHASWARHLTAGIGNIARTALGRTAPDE
jgi:hypothetical protein